MMMFPEQARQCTHFNRSRHKPRLPFEQTDKKQVCFRKGAFFVSEGYFKIIFRSENEKNMTKKSFKKGNIL